MSDSSVTFAEISVPDSEAPARAVRVRTWLLEHGIAVPNEPRDSHLHPSELAAGPQYLTATDDIQGIGPAQANSGIDLLLGRQVHTPAGNYQPPRCPTCGTMLDPDDHIRLVDVWLVDEPNVDCPACGAAALIGDWPGEWTLFVASFAVRFNNWPPLRREFTTDLTTVVGERVRIIRAHL